MSFLIRANELCQPELVVSFSLLSTFVADLPVSSPCCCGVRLHLLAGHTGLVTLPCSPRGVYFPPSPFFHHFHATHFHRTLTFSFSHSSRFPPSSSLYHSPSPLATMIPTNLRVRCGLCEPDSCSSNLFVLCVGSKESEGEHRKTFNLRLMQALGTFAAIISLIALCANANLRLEVTADVRRVIDLGVFAFSDNGYVSLQVHDIFIADPELAFHDEPMGFLLDLTNSAQSARVEKNYAKGDGADHRMCFINDPLLKPEQRLSFPINGKKPSELKETLFETKVTVPGLYALFFYNCKGFNDTTSTYLRPVPISFGAVAVMYNTDNKGTKHFLSWADQYLPKTYMAFSVVFFVLTFFWWRKMKENPLHLHKVHSVMLFLLVVKAISLLLESAKLHHYDLTGAHSVWDVFYYIALTVKGITLFSVLLLLGSGWSVLKQFLSEHDKKIMLIILPSQILVNISIAMIDETSEGSKNWSSWSDMLQILDVVCCCCVLLPIVWSIKNLRDAAAQDDKAARAISRMKKFRTFYIVIVAYIYFTRIIIVMIENSLSYENVWLSKASRELVAVLFYVYTGLKFQPVAENPYLEIDRDDAEELEIRKEVANGNV